MFCSAKGLIFRDFPAGIDRKAIREKMIPSDCLMEGVMSGPWTILEMMPGKWAWERANADGSSTRVGVFESHAECVADAECHGYQPPTERRQIQRDMRLLPAWHSVQQ
jgi:hypothetical protein